MEKGILATSYFQHGKNAQGKNMAGKMASIQMSYTAWKDWRFQIGTDWFSGDPISNDNKQSNFKKLYGSDHTFNGYMDYWNTPLKEGLLDYYVGATEQISLAWNAEMSYHVFNTEKHLTNGKTNLGSELDCLIQCKLNAQTNLQAGWCCYFNTPTTLLAKNIAAGSGVKFPQWAYVMLTIKPTLLKNQL